MVRSYLLDFLVLVPGSVSLICFYFFLVLFYFSFQFRESLVSPGNLFGKRGGEPSVSCPKKTTERVILSLSVSLNVTSASDCETVLNHLCLERFLPLRDHRSKISPFSQSNKSLLNLACFVIFKFLCTFFVSFFTLSF